MTAAAETCHSSSGNTTDRCTPETGHRGRDESAALEWQLLSTGHDVTVRSPPAAMVKVCRMPTRAGVTVEPRIPTRAGVE